MRAYIVMQIISMWIYIQCRYMWRAGSTGTAPVLKTDILKGKEVF